MNVKQVGEKFEVSFQYDKTMIAAIKRIHGRQWNPVQAVWTIPISKEDELRDFFNKYKDRDANLRYELELERLLNLPAEILPVPELPELEQDLGLVRDAYEFQKRGVAYCLRHKRVIIGDKPGLGKTTQAIATIFAADAFPCLVVCPSTLKQNWCDEWRIVAGKRAIILDDKNKANSAKYYQSGVADVFIVNFESVKRFFVAAINVEKGEKFMVKDILFSDHKALIKSIVVDELHRLKETKTQITKFVTGLARGKEWILGLTGTPVVNKTTDLIAQLFVINRIQDFGGLDYFERRYTKSNTYLPELQNRLKRICFYQRAKEEVLSELPSKVRQKVLVDITNRQEYNDALKDLEDYLRRYKDKTDEEIAKSLRGEVMVRINICKQIAARGKLDAVTSDIEDLLAAGEKVVVFVYQKAVVIELLKRFPEAVTVTGKDDPADRDANVKRFQLNPTCRIIICSIKAGGVGITLTASSFVLMVELPWHAADSDQCEDRTHRIGQEFQVNVKYYLGHKTIDEVNYEIIEEKRALGEDITGTNETTHEEVIDRIHTSLFNGQTL